MVLNKKIDHVFHSLEKQGIEVTFGTQEISLYFPLSGLRLTYPLTEFKTMTNLAKFLAHKFEVKYHEPRV